MFSYVPKHKNTVFKVCVTVFMRKTRCIYSEFSLKKEQKGKKETRSCTKLELRTTKLRGFDFYDITALQICGLRKLGPFRYA